jgi:hypothetical protein
MGQARRKIKMGMIRFSKRSRFLYLMKLICKWNPNIFNRLADIRGLK